MADIISVLQAAAGAGGDSYWIALLGGSSGDAANAVAIDSADNIIVAGSTQSDGAGLNDALIAKFNASGVLQWGRTLGGSGTDAANAVAIDSADNLVAVGRTNSDGAGGNDLLIAKFNASGALQWDRTLGGSGNDVANAVAIDSSDNIFVAGTESSTDTFTQSLIAKYNSSGSLLLDKTLGDGGIDEAHGVAVKSSDDIVLVGENRNDAIFARYNSSIQVQGDRSLAGGSTDVANAVAIDSSDNIILVGSTESDGAGGEDCLIAKYNSSGVIQWQRTLGGSAADVANAVAIDSADNIIVAGSTQSDGAGGEDCLIAKLPPDGSGTGTYGSLVYQGAVLTDAAAALTDGPVLLTTANAGLTDAEAVLQSPLAVLTEELIEITP